MPTDRFCVPAHKLLQPVHPSSAEAQHLMQKILPEIANNLLIMETEEDAKQYREQVIECGKRCPTILCLDGFVLVR